MVINFFKLKSIAQLDDKISKFKSITKNIENQEDLFSFNSNLITLLQILRKHLEISIMNLGRK